MGRNTESNYAIGVFDVDADRTIARGASEHADYAPVFIFNANRVVPTADENRPKSIALLGCKKDPN